MTTNPHVIFLNGTSSSGKTTLGRAIRKNAGTTYSLLSSDLFWESVEPDLSEDHGFYAALHRGLFAASTELLALNFNLILDVVLHEEVDLRNALTFLKNHTIYLVGVHCSLEELERREKARGNREIGLARKQFDIVHRHGFYDVEVNTATMTPQECAATVLAMVNSGAHPTTFSEVCRRYEI